MPHAIFNYANKHDRQHHPQGYAKHGEYKPWLRDEFCFRCVYCLERENWYPNTFASFSVDHVLPKSTHKHLECDYLNLVYACVRCNSAKCVATLIDPTKVNFADHLRVLGDGQIEGITAEGRDLIDLLHLDKDPALATRRKYLGIARIKERRPACKETDELFQSAFGFPTTIPDLRKLRPPAGNDLKSNENNCYFVRNELKLLPSIY